MQLNQQVEPCTFEKGRND